MVANRTGAIMWLASYIAVECAASHVERWMPALVFDLCPVMFPIASPIANMTGYRSTMSTGKHLSTCDGIQAFFHGWLLCSSGASLGSTYYYYKN